MLYTQVPANTFNTLQMNVGIMVDEFTPATGVIGNILGATTGGITFNSNPEYEDFGSDVDNVPANTYQLKRILRFDPALSGTFCNMTSSLAKRLAGAAGYDGEDTTHIIPTHKLKAGDFEDFWYIADYSAHNDGVGYAGFMAIHIMKGLNVAGFQWTTTKDGKGNFPFEFHGHYDITNIDQVPFEIFIKEGSEQPTSGGDTSGGATEGETTEETGTEGNNG